MKKSLSFKEQIEIIKKGDVYEQASGIFGIDVSYEEASLVLLPVSWDGTASYKLGTSKAPAAILEASDQIDHHDLAFGQPYKKGIQMLEEDKRFSQLNEEAHVIKSSDKTEKSIQSEINSLSHKVNELVEEASDKALSHGKIVGLVGGEHSCPFGLIKSLSKKHESFGILHIDAHFDLRKAYEGFEHSHASIMHNVLEKIPQVKKLSSFAIRDFCTEEFKDAEIFKKQGRAQVFFDRDLYRARQDNAGFKKIVKEALEFLPEKVYISFDIDGLESRFCPSTGTPVPGGLPYNDAVYLIEELAFADKEIIGFDLVEVAPDKTGAQWDENVAMRLLYKLCGAALHRKK